VKIRGTAGTAVHGVACTASVVAGTTTRDTAGAVVAPGRARVTVDQVRNMIGHRGAATLVSSLVLLSVVAAAVPAAALTTAAHGGGGVVDVAAPAGIAERTADAGETVAGASATQRSVARVADRETGVELSQQVVERAQGEVVVLTFSFKGRARRANVTLGDQAAVGYEVWFQVTDGDGDGKAVVHWNTDAAGRYDGGLSVETDGDRRRRRDRFTRGPVVVDGVEDTIEPANYPLEVVTAVTDQVTDLGTVVLTERNLSGLTVHTAPASASLPGSVDRVERHISQPGAGGGVAVGERRQDWVVVQLSADGLAGYVDGVDDLAREDGLATVTVAQDASTVGINAEPVQMSVRRRASLVVDHADNEYYLVFRPQDLLAEGASVGDRFNVTATVRTDDGNRTLRSQFRLVEAQSQFATRGGRLPFTATSFSEVTGTTTWAPGTRLLVVLQSSEASGDATPFLVQQEAVVDQDGTWDVRFDLSEPVAGQSIRGLLFRVDTGAKMASTTGQLGVPSASIRFDDQVAQDGGTLVTVDQVAVERGGFVALHRGNRFGPVVGTSGYLGNGTHSDVGIRLDVGETIESDTRLVAVVHLDTDDDRTLDYFVTDGAVDVPYTDLGATVRSAGTARLPTPTPTVTPTPTPSPSVTATATGSSSPAATGTSSRTPRPTTTERPRETATQTDDDGFTRGLTRVDGVGAWATVLTLLGGATLLFVRR
jgi:hypothetical protein